MSKQIAVLTKQLTCRYSSSAPIRPTRAQFKLPPKRKAAKKKQTGSNFAKWSTISVPILTFGLGVWQVKRKKWKVNLIEQINNRTKAKPMQLPKDLREIKNMEYCPVKVTGVFDHSKEMYLLSKVYVDPKSKPDQTGGLFSLKKNVGIHVITPLYLPEHGFSILINRGFIPRNKRDVNSRKQAQIDGPVTLSGLVRHGEKEPSWMKNTPENREYVFRDINGMARSCNAAPVWLDCDAESSIDGGPIGGQTNIYLRDEHTSYFITWFTLSLFTSVGWYYKFIKHMHK